MSKTVDERVVEMRFDNKQFESNVKQSMSTIDRLKSALKFDKGVDGLSKIGKAAKNVDMHSLASSVDQVKSRFSALDIVGVTALANITNSAVNAGKKMVKALTLDPIMSGFQEYETKINAVQTIMANTSKDGMTMQDVTNVLDDLNYYADKTIYNFTEMTRNIGTFTAAGVGLYDAAGAIKGIANLAAVSGSNSQQASTAMYQLSQALAAGTVKLQDWNSVVNAGMGGTKFQEALKQTARDMGIGVDAMIEKAGSFRESLRSGWMTADVLNQTLKNFTVEGAAEYAQSMLQMGKYTQEQADALMREAQIAEDAATKVKTFTQLWDVMKEAAQSGWAQTWEIIIGDFEEAKEFLTPIADTMSAVIAESANARNSVLESGLRSSWKTLANDIRAAGIDVNDFQEKLISVGKTHGVITDEMIVDAGGFEQSLKSGWASGDIFAEALRSYKKTAEDFGITTESMQDHLTEFQQTVKEVWDSDLVTQQERMRALSDAGYDYNEVQDLISKTLRGQGLTLDELSIAQMKALGFTQDEIMALQDMAGQAEDTDSSFNQLIQDLTKPSGRELFLEGFTNILMNFIHILDVLKEAWHEAFPSVEGSTLYGWMEAFRDLTARFSLTAAQAEELKWTFRGLFSVMHMLYKIVTVPLSIALEAILAILPHFSTPILEITGHIGRLITWFDKLIFRTGAYERAVRALPEVMKKVINVLKMWFDEFKELPQVQEFMAKVQDKFNTFTDFMKERIGDTGTAMKAFILQIKSMDKIHLTDLPNIFKDFYHNVLNTAIDFDGIFVKIREGLANFFETLKSLGSGIVSVFQGIASKLAALGSKIKAALKDNLDIGDIVSVLVAGGTIAALKKFADLIDLIAGPAKGLTKVLGAVEGVFKSMDKLVDAKVWDVRAKSIKTIATALLELAGALYIIAQIPSDKLLVSVGVIVGLGAALVGFSAAMNKWGGPAGLEKCAAALIAFGAAVALISLSLKQIGDIDPERLAGSVIALMAVIGSLTGASVLLSRFAPEMSKGSRFLLSFGIAIKVLVSALEQMNRIDAKDLPKTVALLVGAIGTLAALAKLAAGVDWAGGAGLVMMVGSVKLLIMLIDDLASIEPGQALKAIVGMIPVVMMLQTLVNILAGRSFTGNIAKAGAAILLMSGSVLLLATAMKIVASIDPAGALIGIVAINTFLISFAGILIFLNRIKGQMIKAAVSLTIMSGAIGILAGVMVLLSMLDPAGMGRALAAIVILEYCFAQILAMSHYARKANMKTIIALSGSIAALAAVMVALSLIDPASLIRATASLTAIMGMFTLLLRATAVAQKVSATIFVMLGVVTLLAGLLMAMAQLPVDASIASASALSILLITMTACLYALSALRSPSLKAVGALALLTTVVTMLAFILGAIAEMDIDISIETAASLALLLTTMTGVLAALSVIGTKATKAIPAAAAFDAVIGIIGALMVAVGALSSYFPGMKKFVTEGIELLSLVASGIGQVLGNLVGGAVEGFSSHLGGMADNLSDFMERLGPFIRGASRITPKMSEGISSLATMVLNLTKADFMNGISKFINGGSSLTEFAQELIPFGEALTEFSKKTKGINAEQMMAVADAAQALADMAGSLPESGGLKQKLTGVKDMKAFIADIEPLADSLIKFNKKITAEGAIDIGAMSKVTKAAQELADMANAIPSQGGLKEKVMGAKDLAEFGDQVVSLGKSLTDFSSSIGEINVEKMSSVTKGAQALADLNASLPSIGGVAQFFAGEKNLGNFGEQLSIFGEAISKYSSQVAGKIDMSAVESSAAAGKVMAALADSLPDPGFFSLKYDFKQFGTQLESFGTSMASYANSIAGIENLDVVESSAAAGTAMVNLLKELPENKITKNETWLDEFGFMLRSFGVSFAAFAKSVADVDMNAIDPIIVAVGELTDMSVAVASVDMEGFKTLVDNMREITKMDFSSGGEQLKSFGSDMLAFSNMFTQIEPASIENATKITESLIELQNALPQDDLFVNEEWIDDFGYRLVSFGNNLVKFHTTTKEISADQMQPLVETVTKLSDMAIGLNGVDMEGFKTFVNSLGDFGRVGNAIKRFKMALGDMTTEDLDPAMTVIEKIGELAVNANGIDTEGFESMITALVKLGKQDLSSVSENIKTFGESFREYNKSMEGVDATKIGEATKAAEGLQALCRAMPTTAEMKTKLNLGDFGDMLPKLGEKLAEFSGVLKDGSFDNTFVNSATASATGLSRLANGLPESASYSKKLSITQFANMLPSLGENMALFSKSITGDNEIDNTAIQAAKDSAEMLSSLAKDLPDSTTFSSKMNLVGFSGQLPSFGKNMALFAQSLGDEKIDTSAVSTAKMSAQILADLSENLPDYSVLDAFAGKETLKSFSAQLPTFGENMASFAANLGDEKLNMEVVDSARSAAEVMATLAELMPEEGMLSRVFGGNQSLGEFASQLPEFGKNMAEFSAAITGAEGGTAVNTVTIQAVANTAKTIAEVSKIAQESANAFGIQNGLTYFGADLKRFGTSVAEFANEIAGVNLSGFDVVPQKIRTFIDLAKDLQGQNVGGALKEFSAGLMSMADISISNIVSKLNAGANSVRAAVTNLMAAFNNQLATDALIPTRTITTMVNQMVSQVTQAGPRFSTQAAGMMRAFHTAIMEGLNSIETKFSHAIQRCVTAIRDKYPAFSQAGGYIIQGLIRGMTTREQEVYNTARRIAQNVSRTINDALEIKSPSRKTMQSGMYVAMGLAQGMEKYSKLSNESAAKMAGGVITSMQKELKINSPSITARDEVGKYIIDGIAEGIEANTSAEEAAAQKAQNIIEAFQNEFQKFQNTWDTADLQFQLYKALNQDTLSETQMKEAELEFGKQQLKFLAESVENAAGKYQTMVDTFGEASDEAREAMNDWLQKQIDLANQAKSVQDIIKEINDKRTEYNNTANEMVVGGDRFKKYQEALESMKPAMDQFGYTFEQIDEIARRQTGYGEVMKQELLDTTKTIQQYVSEAMTGVTGLYSEFSKTGFGTALEEYAKNGGALMKSTSDGITSAANEVKKATEKVVDAGKDTVDSKTEAFEEAGQRIGTAFADGIESSLPEVEAAAERLAKAAEKATQSVKKVETLSSKNSPGGNSGKTVYSVGNQNGFVTTNGKTYTSSALQSGWYSSGSSTSKTMADDIADATSKKLANDVVKGISEAASNRSSSNEVAQSNVTNNYNFTQTNTSPKALSASTIYRQSNNLFSMLKITTGGVRA